MTTWTDQNTIETSYASDVIGVRVISEINNSYLFNQPELNYLGYYLENKTNYTQESSVETAWRDLWH